MTKANQKRIARDLCAGLKAEMLEACDKIPAYWDGHELRTLLCDLAKERFSSNAGVMIGQRKRDYDNTRLEVNL